MDQHVKDYYQYLFDRWCENAGLLVEMGEK